MVNKIPSSNHGTASTGGNPNQKVKGMEITPAINTVAVTAEDGSGRERAAAFQPAWKMALNRAAKKGIKSNAVRFVDLICPRNRF